MAYNPISGNVVQTITQGGNVATDYYLKFYVANTTTPLSMATDATGGTLLSEAKLNDYGYPISNPLDNESNFIPYMNQNYRLVIYPSKADADADNTSAAIINIPEVEAMLGADQVGTAAYENIEDIVTQAQGRSINFMTYGGTANAITLTPIGNGSTSRVDGDRVTFRATATNTGAVTINGQATVTPNGDPLPSGFINIGSNEAEWDATNSWYIVTPPSYWMLGGAGQSWLNVVGSRSANTTYTNSTDRSISVIVTTTSSFDTATFALLVDGVTVSEKSDAASGATRLSITATVASGSTYRVNTTRAIDKWFELRS